MDTLKNEANHVPLKAHSEWPSHARHYEELDKAQSRIGRTPLKAMQWAMGFVAITDDDLARLSKGELENLSYEVAVFSILGTRRLRRIKAGKTILMDGTWGGAKWGTKKSFDESIPSSREVRTLQVEVTKLVENILAHRSAELALDQTKLFIAVGKDHGHLMTFYGRIQDRFMFHIAHLLADFGPRLKRCRADRPFPVAGPCSRVFVSVRQDQVYCSRKCESRMTTRQLRHSKTIREEKQSAQSNAILHQQPRKNIRAKATKKKGGSHGQTRRQR